MLVFLWCSLLLLLPAELLYLLGTHIAQKTGTIIISRAWDFAVCYYKL